MKRTLFVIIIFMIIIGCKDSSEPSDSVTLNIPNEGYIYTSFLNLYADISIKEEIKNVSWLLNDRLIALQHEAPYDLDMDTDSLVYGEVNELSVIVKDIKDKEIASKIYEIIKIPHELPSSLFQSIGNYTETDENGNLVGTIDVNDWQITSIIDIDAPLIERYATIHNMDVRAVNNHVFINWETDDVYDNLGFNLFRGTASTDYLNNQAVHLNYNQGLIRTNTINYYTYQDNYSMNYDVTYYYWIEIVNSDSTKYPYPENGYDYTHYDPDEFERSVSMCYPNPAGSETTIPFTLKENSEITLMFFNSDKSYFEVPVTKQEYQRGNNTYTWSDLPVDAGLYRCLYYIHEIDSDSLHYGYGDIFVHSAQ